MRGCAMSGRGSPLAEDEAEALYQARHARAHCAPCCRHTALTTAEVHDYPSSESGIATDCRRRARSDDEDASHSPDERDLDEILPARLAAASLREPRWTRDNIAATMERFEPADYCYAYYDAQRNMSMPSSSRKAGRQRARAPPGRHARHAYVTRYGTEENIYEEIAEGSRSCPRHRHRQSLVSLDRSGVAEEYRRVESRHKRVLGELNLSVEAMLMAECESPDEEAEAGRGEARGEETLVGPTDELLSPASCQPPDLDSGFSGSSSGASCVGSLRYKTPAPAVAYGARAGVRIVAGGGAAGGAGRGARARSCGDKGGGFWNRKWRRLPGFNSTSSINKAGLAVPATQTESWWCRWIP